MDELAAKEQVGRGEQRSGQARARATTQSPSRQSTRCAHPGAASYAAARLHLTQADDRKTQAGTWNKCDQRVHAFPHCSGHAALKQSWEQKNEPRMPSFLHVGHTIEAGFLHPLAWQAPVMASLIDDIHATRALVFWACLPTPDYSAFLHRDKVTEHTATRDTTCDVDSSAWACLRPVPVITSTEGITLCPLAQVFIAKLTAKTPPNNLMSTTES